MRNIQILILSLIFISCSKEYSFRFETKYEKKYIIELKNRYELLSDIDQKINWAYDVIDFFKQFKKDVELKIFLGEYAEREKDNSFKSYLYFLISNIYWEENLKESSYFYMKKIEREYYDLQFNSQPIGYIIALKTIEIPAPFKDKESMYKLLLEKYTDMIDYPYTAYEFAKLYKSELEMEKAIGILKDIINFINNSKSIEDSVNITEIKKEVDFYYMKKNWVYYDLEELINNIKQAIITRNVYLLSTYASKINFSCSIYNKTSSQNWGWKQLGIDRFWNSNIVFSSRLEDISNENEAYLKTLNWAFPQLTTWYFYFKRVNYPYDQSIDRGWEWAGIIFGDMF